MDRQCWSRQEKLRTTTTEHRELELEQFQEKLRVLRSERDRLAVDVETLRQSFDDVPEYFSGEKLAMEDRRSHREPSADDIQQMRKSDVDRSPERAMLIANAKVTLDDACGTN